MTHSTHDVFTQPAAPNDRAITALIFSTLYIVYLLTFSGVFRTVDELAMYDMSESLVQQGNLERPQVLFALYHNFVGPIEPGQALLGAPLYAVAQLFANVNNIHVVMLLAPLVTALNATLLYRIGRRLDHKPVACLALALTFGLATLAWPYSRTLLREPLLALIFTLALYAYVVWRRGRHTRWLVVMLGWLMLGTLVKSVAIIIAPIFLILVAIDWLRANPHNRRRIFLIGGAAFLSLIVVGAVMILVRYGSFNQIADYLVNFLSSNPLLVIYGLLFSPGKGIVFYMPIILIAWLAIVLARRDRLMYIFLSGLTLLGMAFIYGNNPFWYGGQAWGPRFLVPLVPLAIFPLIDRIEKRMTWIFIALSFVLQLGVSTSNWALSHQTFNRVQSPFETTIGLDPAYWYLSPPLTQLRFWTFDRADLLWAHPDPPTSFTFDAILPLGLIAALVLSIFLLRNALRYPSLRIWDWPVPLLLLAVSALLLARSWNLTPDYPGLSLETAQTIARPAFDSNDYTAVTVSNEFHIYFMQGLMKGRFQHFWYSPVQSDGFDDLLQADHSRKLTLTIDRVHLTPDLSGDHLRDWLNLNAYQFGGGFVEGYERMNYVWGPPPSDLTSLGASFGNILQLDTAGIGGEVFMPGDVIPIELQLRKRDALPFILIVATQLSNQDGVVIGGHKGPIQFGTLNLDAWPINSSVIDRRGFPIPIDVAPGNYKIEVGFETLDGFLPTADGRNFIDIGTVSIGAQN